MSSRTGSQKIIEFTFALLLLAGAFFVFFLLFGESNIFKTQKKIDADAQAELTLKANLISEKENELTQGSVPDPDPVPKNKRTYPGQRVFNLQNLQPITLDQAKADLALERKLEEQRQALLAALEIEDKVQGKYLLQSLQELGSVNARSFLVGDLDTGEIIFERKAEDIYPIASITKFFTAFSAVELLQANELATIDASELRVEGSRARFTEGDTLTIRELLYPLLLVSSNDSGEVIANQRDRSLFIDSMNQIAQEQGLVNTGFNDPTGLSINNQSTARELFSFMMLVKNTYPQIVEISRLPEKSIDGYTWRNINRASTFPEFRGGKTGFTNAALQTSIGYYEIQLSNNEVKNLGIVILQSNTRQQDTRNILDYIKGYVAYEEEK